MRTLSVSIVACISVTRQSVTEKRRRFSSTVGSVDCKVVRIVIPCGSDRVRCGGTGGRLSDILDIQTLGDEFAIVYKVLSCFFQARLEDLYLMESSFQVFGGRFGGASVLLIGPVP